MRPEPSGRSGGPNHRFSQLIEWFSQAILVDKTLYLYGSLGLHPSTLQLPSGGVTAEVHLAMKNMGAVLRAAGADYSHVVKTTIFLADMEDYAVVNDVYKSYFSKPYPARTCVQVAKLPLECKVEIDAVAVVG